MLCVHVYVVYVYVVYVVYVEHMCPLSHQLLLQLAMLDMSYGDNFKVMQFEHKLHIDFDSLMFPQNYGICKYVIFL